ncbi:MAG: hypothetical protein JRF02_06970, partial [Deltaproteobacteria bacterium]|nr:hypothetical protein [Deltaproteobacteria bacterium]
MGLSNYNCLRYHVFSGVIAFIAALILLPSLSHASGLTPEFFVSAWLVRLWLAMVCATAIVVGLLIALNSKIAKSALEPTRDADGKIVLSREYRLSYRKLGGGLLCIVLGGALFVTCVFLLPDKRTGNSGIGKIKAHLSGEQYSPTQKMHNDNHKPA